MSDRSPTGAELAAEEPPEPSREEAELLITIYTDLIEFTTAILEQTRRTMSSVAAATALHLGVTDIRIIEEELAVFRARVAVLIRLAEAGTPPQV